jgi:serine/threonine protein kinase
MAQYSLPKFQVSIDLQKDCTFDPSIDEQLKRKQAPAGQFGQVAFGTWHVPVPEGCESSSRDIPIAVKLPVDKQVEQAWLGEAHSMQTIRDIDAGVHGKRYIVTVLGLAYHRSTDGSLCPATVMERLDISLEETLKSFQLAKVVPELSMLLDWMLGLAQGLDAMHEHAHIVHGDIKLANIMVTAPPNQICKLIDFGLSRNRAGDHCVKYDPIGARGTRAYLSPELLENNTERTNTKASDVYALSMVFWCMLALQDAPYAEHGSGLAACKDPNGGVDVHLFDQAIISGMRPPLTAIQHMHPPARLVNLIETCWDKDAQSRLSAAQLVAELESVRHQHHFRPSGSTVRQDAFKQPHSYVNISFIFTLVLLTISVSLGYNAKPQGTSSFDNMILWHYNKASGYISGLFHSGGPCFEDCSSFYVTRCGPGVGSYRERDIALPIIQAVKSSLANSSELATHLASLASLTSSVLRLLPHTLLNEQGVPLLFQALELYSNDSTVVVPACHILDAMMYYPTALRTIFNTSGPQFLMNALDNFIDDQRVLEPVMRAMLRMSHMHTGVYRVGIPLVITMLKRHFQNANLSGLGLSVLQENVGPSCRDFVTAHAEISLVLSILQFHQHDRKVVYPALAVILHAGSDSTVAAGGTPIIVAVLQHHSQFIPHRIAVQLQAIVDSPANTALAMTASGMLEGVGAMSVQKQLGYELPK